MLLRNGSQGLQIELDPKLDDYQICQKREFLHLTANRKPLTTNCLWTVRNQPFPDHTQCFYVIALVVARLG